MKISKGKFLLLLVLAAAFWPTLIWWCKRALDGSDDPWGFAAVILLTIFGGFFSKTNEQNKEGSLFLAVAVLTYALAFPFMPNLIRGSIATFAIAVVISQQRGTGSWHLGTWALASMTLPWLSSLQFFLGYPLRWLTTHLSAAFLSMSGMQVQAEGLILKWGPIDVWVDAPCSGVKMLWVGVFLASALAFIFRLKNLPTLGLLAMGILATIVGNVMRASSVFYLEAGIIDAPDFFHDFIGLVTFVLISAMVSALAFALKKRSANLPTISVKISRPIFAATLISICVPFFTSSIDAENQSMSVSFPTQLEGETLSPRPLSEKDLPYLKGFPGVLKTFTTERHEVLIRHVSKPTRKLHSATDCYRGLGYTIDPLARTNNWARYRVKKGDITLIIEERIRDKNGKLFYDVGAWYWAAMLGSTTGPWWSEVRVRKSSHLESH